LTGEDRKKILIVDDEPDTVSFLSMLLEDSGFIIVSVSDPDDVASLIRDHKPDLVTLDILMPKKSGFRIYSELRNNEEFRGLPVVIISGANISELSQGVKTPDGESVPPPDAVIEKPIEGRQLISTIKSLIRG